VKPLKGNNGVEDYFFGEGFEKEDLSLKKGLMVEIKKRVQALGKEERVGGWNSEKQQEKKEGVEYTLR